jgi:hypothetical protein
MDFPRRGVAPGDAPVEDVKPSADELSGPVWLSQIMDTHAALARHISTSVIAAVAVSVVLICIMVFAALAYNSRRLILIAALVGLWLGALIAGAFCTVTRYAGTGSNGFGDVGVAHVPGWFVQRMGLASPIALVSDIIRWRELTNLLAAQRQYASVRDYLDKEKVHVIRNLVVALVFYFGSSAVILCLLHLWR